MEGQRFDELTKVLAEGGASRRRLLRGLLSGALGGVLASVGLREAAAACPHPLVGCPRIGGECVNLRIDPNNCGRCGRECASEQVCYAARCMGSCPSGFDACGGTCVRACTGNQILNFDTCACEAPPLDVGDSCNDGAECPTGNCDGTCCIEQGQDEFECDSRADCCLDLLCNGDGECVECIEGNEFGCSAHEDCCGDLFYVCCQGQCVLGTLC